MMKRMMIAFAAAAFAGLAAPAQSTEPVPGVDISLTQNPGARMIGGGRTNDSGEFVSEPLETGDYVLFFAAPAPVSVSIEVTPADPTRTGVAAL